MCVIHSRYLSPGPDKVLRLLVDPLPRGQVLVLAWPKRPICVAARGLLPELAPGDLVLEAVVDRFERVGIVRLQLAYIVDTPQ